MNASNASLDQIESARAATFAAYRAGRMGRVEATAEIGRLNDEAARFAARPIALAIVAA